MFWIKKLLFATILGTSIISPSVTLTRKPEAIEQLELEKTLKKWNRLFKRISGGSEMEKLSKIFSKNLTTFSKSALINAVKQLLMGWAIQIWENQEAFFPISQRLNKFFFYHHIYHWKRKNEVEELSWDLIKKFFIDFFFNEKGWFLLSQFGDFSSFVLKEWEEKEKPMKLYEWKMPYSNAGEENNSSLKTSKLYDSQVLETLKTRVPYLFPEIEGNREYSSLISRLTHKNEIELNLFKKRWVTISDLSKITDGYALGALLHMYAQQGLNNNTYNESDISALELKKESSSIDPSKNPLYLFLGQDSESLEGGGGIKECLFVESSLFNEEKKGELGMKDDTCLYGVRWISSGNNGGEDLGASGIKKKILVSREVDGISFYYLSDDSKLKEEDGQRTLQQQEPEVIKKVTKYLTNNFETIFAKFLVSKKQDESGWNYDPFTIKSVSSIAGKKQIWNFSEFFKKNIKIIESSVNYLDSLYWAKKIRILQSALLSVYKHVPKNITKKQGKEVIQLQKTSGLFSPLRFKRSSAFWENEFFDDLLSCLFGKEEEKKIFSLKEKANNLKELLIKNSEEQKLFDQDSLRKLFLNNPYFRAQLEAISGDKLKAIDTIFALKSEEILFPDKAKKSEESERDFSELLKKFLETLKNVSTGRETEGGNDWEDLINKSLFLEPFLTSSIEKKLLYGSFSSNTQGSSGQVNDTKNISLRAKNDWILDNYYFSDSGYESSATNYKELLAFLLSIKWLTENDYANFAKLINHIFSKNKNKNAYLVWTQEITSENKKELETNGQERQQQESQVQSQDSETTLKKFFKETISTELSNPLLKGEYTITNSSNGSSSSGENGTQQKTFSTKNSIYETEAYKNGQANTGEAGGQKTKLSGFLGLVTESFSTREVSPALKKYIFSDFLKFNSAENKNYSVEGANSPVATTAEGGSKGIVEGTFFSDNHKRNLTDNKGLLELLKEAKKKNSLLKYLETDNVNSLLVALSKAEKSEEVDKLTLQELKKELTEGLNGGENKLTAETPQITQNSNIKDLYKLFNRFSGYIYSSKGDSKSPFVFTEKKEEEKYYVGFVYQVNRFDFDTEGIKQLKENLSENTLNTLIVLLASNREIRDWIYESEIIRQLSL